MLIVTWIAVLSVLLLLLVYILHKIRRIHIMLYDLSDQLQRLSDIRLVETTRQLQLLQTLNHELDLPQGLPPTRGWAASPDFLLAIARNAREARPQMMVECSSGVSTIVLARTAQLNGEGHVFSLEHDPAFADLTRGELRRYGLEAHATVIDAPLVPHRHRGEDWPWYDITNLPSGAIDMLVIDGPPMLTRAHARYPAGPVLFNRLRPGARIFLDDAARKDEQDIVTWWRTETPGLDLETPFTEKGCAVLRYPPAKSLDN